MTEVLAVKTGTGISLGLHLGECYMDNTVPQNEICHVGNQTHWFLYFHIVTNELLDANLV